MTFLALLLVVASAGAHATWNVLTKSSIDPFAFIWAMTVVASVIYLPPGIVALHGQALSSGEIVYVIGTVILHLVYFYALAAAYTRSDLSVAYPIARGTGLGLVPLVAALLLREHISTLGLLAMSVILVGVLLTHTEGTLWEALRQGLQLLRASDSQLALVTGVTIAIIQLWDKSAVRAVPPAVLITGIFVGVAIGSTPYVLWTRRSALAREIRSHPLAILAAGILAPLAYLFILIAFTFSRVSYVAPARNLSIVASVLLGRCVLHEPHSANRLIGSIITTIGVIGLALAP